MTKREREYRDYLFWRAKLRRHVVKMLIRGVDKVCKPKKRKTK